MLREYNTRPDELDEAFHTPPWLVWRAFSRKGIFSPDPDVRFFWRLVVLLAACETLLALLYIRAHLPWLLPPLWS
jgi:hypothetical protein